MSAIESELLVDTELGRVIEWRLRELSRAGYSERDARELAERVDIDLHRAIDLVRDGCPPDTAARILL